MAREIRIKIEEDMSKQDEIEVIEKLRNIFEAYPNNYLKSLFTNDFVGWVTNQIKDDFPPDAYDHFCGFECDNTKRRLKKTDCIIAEYDMQVTGFKNREAKLTSNITESRTRYSELEKQFKELLAETADTEFELQKEIVNLEQEIIVLKAKLYDKGEKK